MKHFLIGFDHSKDAQVIFEEFGADSAGAVKRYGELEAQYRDNSAMDIVLVGSDSIESVKVTHANYFEGTARAQLQKLFDLKLFA